MYPERLDAVRRSWVERQNGRAEFWEGGDLERREFLRIILGPHRTYETQDDFMKAYREVPGAIQVVMCGTDEDWNGVPRSAYGQ